MHKTPSIRYTKDTTIIVPNTMLANTIIKYGLDNEKPYTVYQVHIAMLDVCIALYETYGIKLLNDNEHHIGKMLPVYSDVFKAFPTNGMQLDHLTRRMLKLSPFEPRCLFEPALNEFVNTCAYIRFSDDIWACIQNVLDHAYTYTYTHTPSTWFKTFEPYRGQIAMENAKEIVKQLPGSYWHTKT